MSREIAASDAHGAQQPADRVPLVAGDDQRAHQRRSPRHGAVDEGEAVHRDRGLGGERDRLRGHHHVGDDQHDVTTAKSVQATRARTSATRLGRRASARDGMPTRSRVPRPGADVELQRAADGVHPVAHVRQPGPGRAGAGVEAGAVVARPSALSASPAAVHLDPDGASPRRAWRRSGAPPGSRSTPPPRRRAGTARAPTLGHDRTAPSPATARSAAATPASSSSGG